MNNCNCKNSNCDKGNSAGFYNGTELRRSYKGLFFSISMLLPMPFGFTWLAFQGISQDKFTALDFIIAPVSIILSAYIAYVALKYAGAKKWRKPTNSEFLDSVIEVNRPKILYNDKF